MDQLLYRPHGQVILILANYVLAQTASVLGVFYGESMEDRQYIRRPHAGLIAVILILTILETMLVFAPENVPYPWLGPLGTPVAGLVVYHPASLQYIFLVAVTLNAVTGIAAYRLARSRGIDNPARFKWCLHCLLFGVFSLRHLIAFNGNSSTGTTEIV